MNKLKYIFILFIVFLLTGCNATYKLIINENVGVKEEIILEESNQVLQKFTTNINNYLKTQLEDLKNGGTYNLYFLDTYTEGNNSFGRAIKEYNNVDALKSNSTIVKEIFSNISLKKEENIVSLSMEPITDFKYFEEAEEYSAFLEKLNIEIVVPFKVLSNNAKAITNNTYKWEFDKTDKLENINISFDSSKNLNDMMPLSVKILIGGVGVILIIAIYIFIKYKINSK